MNRYPGKEFHDSVTFHEGLKSRTRREIVVTRRCRIISWWTAAGRAQTRLVPLGRSALLRAPTRLQAIRRRPVQRLYAENRGCPLRKSRERYSFIQLNDVLSSYVCRVKQTFPFQNFYQVSNRSSNRCTLRILSDFPNNFFTNASF